MEQTVTCEQNKPKVETLRVFDELASLRMLQNDLAANGGISRETWQQVYNEELSYVAEGINAPLETSFILRYSDKGLVDERGITLQSALQNGLLAAEQAAFADSRRMFDVQRAVHDYHEGQLLNAMMAGELTDNTLVRFTPFPEEAYRKYGKKFLSDEAGGYQPERLLGFIRVCRKISENEMQVVSMTVDNSNLDIFRKLAGGLGQEIGPDATSEDVAGFIHTDRLNPLSQTNLPKDLIGRYDAEMAATYGGEFLAGRPKAGEEEAWGFIESQKDLVEHYFTRLENLANTAQLNPGVRDEKRKLTYSFWAALQQRLKKQTPALPLNSSTNTQLQYYLIEGEMSRALSQAINRGEKLIGCGGSISSSDLLEQSPDDAFKNIFSDKKEAWAWKAGNCRVQSCISPKPTQVGPCNVCRNCQQLFDKGMDPTKISEQKAVKPKSIKTKVAA